MSIGVLKKLFTHRNSGFTLAEVMVASGMVGLLSVVVMNLLTDVNLQRKKLDTTSTIDRAITDMTRIFRNKNLCNYNMDQTGAPFSAPSGLQVTDANIGNAGGVELTTIVSGYKGDDENYDNLNNVFTTGCDPLSFGTAEPCLLGDAPTAAGAQRAARIMFESAVLTQQDTGTAGDAGTTIRARLTMTFRHGNAVAKDLGALTAEERSRLVRQVGSNRLQVVRSFDLFLYDPDPANAGTPLECISSASTSDFNLNACTLLKGTYDDASGQCQGIRITAVENGAGDPDQINQANDSGTSPFTNNLSYTDVALEAQGNVKLGENGRAYFVTDQLRVVRDFDGGGASPVLTNNFDVEVSDHMYTNGLTIGPDTDLDVPNGEVNVQSNASTPRVIIGNTTATGSTALSAEGDLIIYGTAELYDSATSNFDEDENVVTAGHVGTYIEEAFDEGDVENLKGAIETFAAGASQGQAANTIRKYMCRRITFTGWDNSSSTNTGSTTYTMNDDCTIPEVGIKGNCSASGNCNVLYPENAICPGNQCRTAWPWFVQGGGCSWQGSCTGSQKPFGSRSCTDGMCGFGTQYYCCNLRFTN